MMLKKMMLLFVLALGLLIVYAGIVYGPVIHTFLTLETVPLSDNMTAFIGYGGNSVVL